MKYFEQQAGLGSTSKAKTGNSTLALLFFAMGALHLYGMMRSRPSRTRRAEKAIIVANPGIGRYVTVGLVAAATALIVEILVFSGS